MNELELMILTRFAEFYKNNNVDIDNLIILQNGVTALIKAAYTKGFDDCLSVFNEVINNDSVCSL